MGELLERIGVETPVVQAGMGGGIAGAELAAAVSEAGGLGTIGILPPAALEAEIARARDLTEKPIAVNLLLPFATEEHWRAASQADVVVSFWGEPRRHGPTTWLHQAGSVEEARAAQAAGADGVICQGVEAGGHVRGTTPALELLERIRAALPEGYPVWLAGGIVDRADAAAALDAGAEAAVSGTRFLLSDESGAHPEYKRRLLGAEETILTELFGAGWPDAPHRVIANPATERWLGGDRRGPRAVRALHRISSPLVARVPESLQARMLASQRASSPMLSPQPPAAGGPPALLDSGPLYAGAAVGRITELAPAADLLRELSP